MKPHGASLRAGARKINVGGENRDAPRDPAASRARGPAAALTARVDSGTPRRYHRGALLLEASMHDPGELWVRALARAFADDRRVLLVGDSFDLLSALAEAPVRELVVVCAGSDADAPAGQTVTGAPLRLRPDWAERASSKDLIVDPAGLAAPEDVKRILKRRGVYVSGVRGPAIEALPFVTPVRAGQARAVFIGEPPLRTVVDLGAGSGTEAAVFLASQDGPVAPPQLVGLFAAESAPATAGAAESPTVVALETALEAIRVEADGLHGEVEALRDALEAAEAALDQAYDVRDAAEAARQETFEAASTFRARAAHFETLLAEADAARTEAAAQQTAAVAQAVAQAEATTEARWQAERAALEDRYAEARTELAERRVADRQTEAVRARFEQARGQMAAEVAELRAQLMAVGVEGGDAESAFAERDAAQEAAAALQQGLVETLGALAAPWPVGAPPPVSSNAEALAAWLATAAVARQQAVEAAEAHAAQLGRLRAERAELDRNLREHASALAVLRADLAAAREIPTPPPPPAEASLKARIAALEAALAAEVNLRETTAAAVAGELSAAQAVLAGRDAQRAAAAESRRAAAQAELGRAAAEEHAARLHHELHGRSARSAELETMLRAHTEMQSRMVSALAAAEQARDEAVAARRLADENLRLLRREFERTPGRQAGPDALDTAALEADLVGAEPAAEAETARGATAQTGAAQTGAAQTGAAQTGAARMAVALEDGAPRPALVIRALRTTLAQTRRQLAALEAQAANDRARAQQLELERALLAAWAAPAPAPASAPDSAPALRPASRSAIESAPRPAGAPTVGD